ncbi:transcription elongation factor GreA [Verminephrobacter eiseniae]|nr:transcription elongation factor GreA [Verminephrobacter eiseniae]
MRELAKAVGIHDSDVPPRFALAKAAPQTRNTPILSRQQAVRIACAHRILTKHGFDKLEQELLRLKTERQSVITAVAEARAQGGVRKSADYEAAKDRQGFVEGRIQEIEGTLSVAQVIDPDEVDGGGKVVFGATVQLEDEESGDTVTYQIVGEDEADLKQGLINISSPIARALIGKKEGDTAEVQAPSGIRRYEVVAVSYR